MGGINPLCDGEIAKRLQLFLVFMIPFHLVFLIR